MLATDDGTALFDRDATFQLVEGLADEWCVSLRSQNYPDQVVRHSYFDLLLDPDDGTGLFAEDATYCLAAG
ncbi:hypothetical protein GCM10029992_32140 [Glycomyces albus]